MNLGYIITDYGCVGDGVTDNTPAFSKLIETISKAEATVIIPNGRFLIRDIYIPANIELQFFNGGRIVWGKIAKIWVNAYINAGHKWIFENESELPNELPQLGIHRQEWISPIWFGGKMSGSGNDYIINHNALRSAWNSARRLSQTQDGCMIKFPSGTFIMKGMKSWEDGWQPTAKFSDIVGSGRSKTTIMLAGSENKSLFNILNSFDVSFRDIGFNGNAAANTAMTEPLIYVAFYRVNFINFRIENCNADGLSIRTGQANAYHIHDPLIFNVKGIGIKLSDVINCTIDGLIDIESTGTGIMVTSTMTTSYNSRYNSRVFIHGSWYGEKLVTGLHILGTCSVKAEISAYMRTTKNFVLIAYDKDRNMPAKYNYIDTRGSRDEKALGVNNIIIDSGCTNNTVLADEGTNIIDYNIIKCKIRRFFGL